MFQTSHQTQTQIKHTIIKTIGTNNEGSTQEHKPHVNNNPTTLIIIRHQHQTYGKHNNSKTNKTTHMFKLLWLRIKTQTTHVQHKQQQTNNTQSKYFQTTLAQGAHGQTSLNIFVFCCFIFACFICIVVYVYPIGYFAF